MAKTIRESGVNMDKPKGMTGPKGVFPVHKVYPANAGKDWKPTKEDKIQAKIEWLTDTAETADDKAKLPAQLKALRTRK